jgi:hypothetical protein
MIEDMQVRNLSPHTQPSYVQQVVGRDGDLRASLYKALLIETQLGLDAQLIELYQSWHY